MNNPKSKFIPPIKTASSFLKNLSDTNDCNKYELSPVLETPKGYKLERFPSINLQTSINSRPLPTSLKFPRNQKSKSSRDVSHLQDICRSPRLNLDQTLSPSIYILPTDPERLKLLMQVTSPGEKRIKSKASQVCFRSTCIENISENFSNSQKTFNLNSNDFGLPSSQSDLMNLKEWFKLMKENYLVHIIDENRPAKYGRIIEPDRLETFELIVKAGMKELLRQLHVINVERWEILTELIHHLNVFWESRLESVERVLTSTTQQDKRRIQQLSAELQDISMNFKEKEIQLNKDLGVSRLESLLKDQQIQQLEETVRKLKAERIHRGKQELQRYNHLLKVINGLKCFSDNQTTNEEDLAVSKALTLKKEELVSLILNKTQAFKSEKTSQRLSDQQLIEYEMLVTNSDEIFLERGIQIEYSDFCRSHACQSFIYTHEVACLTDEILEVVVEETSHKKKEKQLSIMVTNEKEEQIETQIFDRFENELSEGSGNNSPFPGPGESQWDDRTGRRRSVVGLYKTRETRCFGVQTEDKYFWEKVKQDEEEITKWIMQDRKNKLTDLEKEILNSKKQLRKLNSFLVKHKGHLHSSLTDGTIELDSDDTFDLSEDADLEYLKSIGIIGQEIHLASWREGYYYAIEKVSGTKKTKEDSISSDYSEILEEPARPLKSQRNQLGDDLFKRKNTKISEFNFRRKDLKHHSFKPSTKPKFLENFLENFKMTGKRIATMSKKNLLKAINSLYTTAICKNNVFDFEPLHLFVYEEFLSRYITKSAVDKKIVEFMAALVSYKDEKKIKIFNKLFGVSLKNDIPRYSRPKQAFNFFVNFNRMLDSSHHGIDVGEINRKVYVPSIRAVECTKEMHLKYFETYRLNVVLNVVEKNFVNDPNKINKNLIEKDVLIEILLDHYDEFNKNIEKFLFTLLEPFQIDRNKKKIHKIDFLMVLKFFSYEKYLKIFGSSPFEFIEKSISHSRSKTLMSLKKAVDLCFSLKILFPEEIGNDYRKFINEINSFDYYELRNELQDCQDQLKIINGMKERLQIDNDFINRWEVKIMESLEDLNSVGVKERVGWKVFCAEMKRFVLDC